MLRRTTALAQLEDSCDEQNRCDEGMRLSAPEYAVNQHDVRRLLLRARIVIAAAEPQGALVHKRRLLSIQPVALDHVELEVVDGSAREVEL